MTTISATQLANVRVHGLGLTDDFLLKLSDRAQTAKVDGATPASYGLAPKVPLEEAILDAWNAVRKAWEIYDRYGTDTWTGWVRPLLKALDYSFGSSGAIGGKYAVRYLTETGDVPLHYAPPVMEGDRLKPADLDRVTQHGEPGHGTLRASPHGLMQGYLNATPGHLWGLVTNGEVLRLLRDNAQVTRPAYAEFNIGEMMRTEDARAFRVLYLLLHRSRLKDAKASILEGWNTTATTEGVKARDSLRDGVQRAIEHLGTGFLEKNPDLYETLRDSNQAKTDLYRACLNMVYQLVFLFVTEDRDLLFARDDKGDYIPDAATRERATHYLTRAMRARAATLTGTNTHTDAYAGWERLLAHVRVGFGPLGLPALGSHLFQPNALTGLKLGNQAFYAALRALSEITVDNQRRPVNYAGLDSEELGSIYESLLELVPRVQPGPRFELQTLAGNERKTTGSYYTPSGLINLLLDSALEPVIEDATRDKQPTDAIAALKKLKIIDPACGSGHFLIAAARRVGARLAELEEETSQPSPAAQRRATRTVIAHCIYGADINPMAIELAKVALWLESQDAGKPLAFLDHRLRVGNSLLGISEEGMQVKEVLKDTSKKNRTADKETIVKLLALPDEAFSVLEGDDRKTVTDLKKLNKQERKALAPAAGNQPTLLGASSLGVKLGALNRIEPNTLQDVQAQASTFQAIETDADRLQRKTLADAWCAAFVLPKVPGVPAMTTADLYRLQAGEALPTLRQAVAETARQYRFLHPHIEFPDVFEDEHQGGFDCVLGNPPWERIKLQEKEWFAQRVPEVAEAPNAAARTKLINALKTERPQVYADFQRDLRQAEGESQFIRASGRYPLTGRGDVNTYAIFSEANRDSLNPRGRMGIIVPTGIATDDTTKFFFQSLMDKKSLASLYDFENREGIFPGVHRSFKFCMLTVSGDERPNHEARFAFFALNAEEATDPGKVFTLAPEEIALLNPNTRTAPVFRSARDASISKQIYQSIPTMAKQNGDGEWKINFLKKMVDLSIHKADVHFDLSENLLPVKEGKTISIFNHRYASYSRDDDDYKSVDLSDLINKNYDPSAKYFVSKDFFEKRIFERKWSAHWFLSFRDVARSTDDRTGIFVIRPHLPSTDKLPTIFFTYDRLEQCGIYANLTSFIFDYCLRQKVGGINVGAYLLEQNPVLPRTTYANYLFLHFAAVRVLELTYTAYDLTDFARDLNYPGDPFTWNDERRFWLRAELDALYFILYGINRDDVDYIMETFPIVKRKDIAAHGTYRTKDAILAIYDELHTLGLERLGEYQSRVLTLGLDGGDVAGGWRP